MRLALLFLLLFGVCACAEAAHLAQARTVADISAPLIEGTDLALAEAIRPNRVRCEAETGGRDPEYSQCMATWIRAAAALQVVWQAHKALGHGTDAMERHQDGNIGGTLACFFAAVGDFLKAADKAGMDMQQPAIRAWAQYSAMMGSVCHLGGDGELGSGSAGPG